MVLPARYRHNDSNVPDTDKYIGAVVEYLEQGRLHAGLVVREQANQVAVIGANSREKVFSRDLVLLRHPEHKATRENLSAVLATIEEERTRLSADLDLNLLWEIVAEQGRGFSADELAELFFGSRTPGTTSVMLEALLQDRLYFVRRHMEFVPRSAEQVDTKTRGHRKTSHSDGNQSCHVRAGLRDRDSRLQPGQGLVAEVPEIQLAAIPPEGHNQGGIVVVEKMKSFGQDTDDLPRLSVHRDRAPNDVRLGAKLLAPVAVGQQHGGHRARRIVLAGEQAPQRWNDTQQRQRAVGNVQPRYMLRFSCAGYVERVAVVGADILQGCALLAVDKVDGWRHVQIFEAQAWGGVPDSDQPVGMRIRQGLQQDAFDDAENHGVRAHPHGESDQRYCGKQRRAAQPSQHLPELIHAPPTLAGTSPGREKFRWRPARALILGFEAVLGEAPLAGIGRRLELVGAKYT